MAVAVDEVMGVESVEVDAVGAVVATIVVSAIEEVEEEAGVLVVAVLLADLGFLSETKISPGANCLPPLPEGFSCFVTFKKKIVILS